MRLIQATGLEFLCPVLDVGRHRQLTAQNQRRRVDPI
jgi:hypothetical protein